MRLQHHCRLNKAILDQGWFEFRRQLEYKTLWTGGWLVIVPAHDTSRTCPRCGNAAAANRPTQARFAGVAGGHTDYVDVVGAINVLRVGHAQFVCRVGGALRSPATGTHRSDPGADQRHTQAQ
jgi:putative transposase